MIIEFTGIPGSGKSTILNKLKDELKNENYVFNISRFLIQTENIVLFDLYLLLNFYKLKKKDWKILFYSVRYLNKSKNPFYHKLNIIRNIYKKLVIFRILNKKKEVFFVDEGISHIPFNIFVDGESDFKEEDIKNFIDLLPLTEKLLVVDASDDILLNRVLRRGHKRIDMNDINKIKKFMSQSRQVLETIKRKRKVLIYLNEGEIRMKNLQNLLGLNDV